MTSTDPLSESFVCLARGHAGCTQEKRNGELWVTHWPAPTIPTPEPADDVREALAEESDFAPSTEQVRSHYVFDQSNVWRPERGRAFDRWLAAEVRPRGTVTDAEVEAGAQVLYAADPILYSLPKWREKIGTPKPWSALNEGTRDVYRKRARPVLEAAAEARRA